MAGDAEDEKKGEQQPPKLPCSKQEMEATAEDMTTVYMLEGCEAPYHDYLEVPIRVIKSQMEAPESKRKGPRGGVTVPFPIKLYEMLVGVQCENLDHIVSWAEHGRCFAIHYPQAFVDEIMPLYFRQSKLTSFQRQLNLYGFQRVSSHHDRGAYYHPLFLRSRPDICEIMLRQRVKGGTVFPISNKETTTDATFSTLPRCQPISATARVVTTNVSCDEDASVDEELLDSSSKSLPAKYPLSSGHTQSSRVQALSSSFPTMRRKGTPTPFSLDEAISAGVQQRRMSSQAATSQQQQRIDFFTNDFFPVAENEPTISEPDLQNSGPFSSMPRRRHSVPVHSTQRTYLMRGVMSQPPLMQQHQYLYGRQANNSPIQHLPDEFRRLAPPQAPPRLDGDLNDSTGIFGGRTFQAMDDEGLDDYDTYEAMIGV